jgi:hypothetical protein
MAERYPIRRNIILLGVALWLAFAAIVRADQLITLESLRTAYFNGTDLIACDVQRQDDEARVQYGKTLESLQAEFKQKGDFNAYMAVNTERKRFQTDKTILPKEPNAYVANAVATYRKQMSRADTESNQRRAALLKQYIQDLNRLSGDLLIQNKQEDVKAVGEAKYAAECVLAAMTGAKPPGKPVSPSPSDKEASTTPPPRSATEPTSVPMGVPWGKAPSGAGQGRLKASPSVEPAGGDEDDKEAPGRTVSKPEFILGETNDQPGRVKAHGDMVDGLRFAGRLPPDLKGWRFVRGVHGAECTKSGVAYVVASATDNYAGFREQLVRLGWAPVVMKIWDDEQRAGQYVIMKRKCRKGEQLGYLGTLIW